MNISIQIDDPFNSDIIELLQSHFALMSKHTPSGSGHALNLGALKDPKLTFWSAREGSVLLGCIALKELNDKHGEIKSMHVAPTYRRLGVARTLIQCLIAESIVRGYDRLSLETGKSDIFTPSRLLYESLGFRQCNPWGEYINDPFSYCMTKSI